MPPRWLALAARRGGLSRRAARLDRRWAVGLLPALLFAASAAAQTLSLQGTMGAQRAVVVIDGQPQVLAVGQTARGVKLVELRGDEARVERGGNAVWLRVGAAQVQLGAAGGARSSSREIVIPMGQGGHFFVDGAINGRAVRFMVDTGATTIAMSAADAQRLGIDYQKGERALVTTAGGTLPAWSVNLGAVRVGGVEVPNVQATVTPAGMPFVLLGNSFLNRFQMQRTNDMLRLEMR